MTRPPTRMKFRKKKKTKGINNLFFLFLFQMDSLTFCILCIISGFLVSVAFWITSKKKLKFQVQKNALLLLLQQQRGIIQHPPPPQQRRHQIDVKKKQRKKWFQKRGARQIVNFEIEIVSSALGVIFSNNIDFPTLLKCSGVCRQWRGVAHSRSVVESQLVRIKGSNAKVIVDFLRDCDSIWRFLTVIESSKAIRSQTIQSEFFDADKVRFGDFVSAATELTQKVSNVRENAEKVRIDIEKSLKRRGISFELCIEAQTLKEFINFVIESVEFFSKIPTKFDSGIVKIVKLICPDARSGFTTPAFQHSKKSLHFPFPGEVGSIIETIKQVNQDFKKAPIHIGPHPTINEKFVKFLGVRKLDRGFRDLKNSQMEHACLKLAANIEKIRSLIKGNTVIVGMHHSYEVDPLRGIVKIPWNFMI